jgi:hypothetical protein
MKRPECEDFGRFIFPDVPFRVCDLNLVPPLALLPALQQPEQCNARQDDEARGGLWHWNRRRIERIQRVRSH